MLAPGLSRHSARSRRPSAVSARDNAHMDQASQVAARVLTLLPLCLRSSLRLWAVAAIRPSLCVVSYRAPVSGSLREALREQGAREWLDRSEKAAYLAGETCPREEGPGRERRARCRLGP